MPLPNVNIEFTSAAASAVTRSQKGTVAIILKDSAENGPHIFTSATQITAALSDANKKYIERTFLGYVNPPRKVLVYVEPAAATDLTAGLTYFETQTFDYLVGPPSITADECSAVKTWIAQRRTEKFTPKAVLPNTAADSEAIINFTTDDIMVGVTKFNAAQYCSRIAGLIAGTPATISCTFAPLPEVSDVARLSKSAMDEAIDAGKFILFHDGKKVKVGRGINSLTTTGSKSPAFKKIKVVEAIDMIQHDIKLTAQDNYIGKYSNSYNNKCLLISAIRGYFKGLENSGLLEADANTAEIDLDAQEAYLISKGINTSEMTENEIKVANTDDKVFLKATITILDAIEDISLSIII